LGVSVVQVRTSKVPDGYLEVFLNSEAAREANELGHEQGRKEAMEEERQRHVEEMIRCIPKLAARKISAEEIATLLSLKLALVRKVIASTNTAIMKMK
jgi:predicted transposase YdaD